MNTTTLLKALQNFRGSAGFGNPGICCSTFPSSVDELQLLEGPHRDVRNKLKSWRSFPIRNVNSQLKPINKTEQAASNLLIPNFGFAKKQCDPMFWPKVLQKLPK